jgi:hypothetical protein
MNWQTFFNPFSKFSENTLLIGGLLLTILGIVIGFYCNVTFNGVLSMQTANTIEKTTLIKSTIQNVVNVITITIVLLVTGKILNAKTRIIDIINIALWYRLPLYLGAIFTLILLPKDLIKKLQNNTKNPQKIFESGTDVFLIGLFTIIILLLLVYCIVLLTNGFKTATNIKKPQHLIVFAFSIILSQIISQIIFLKIT